MRRDEKTVVEINAACVKFFRGVWKNKAWAVRGGIRKIPGSGKSAQELLSEMVSEFGGRGRGAICLVPRQEVFLKQLPLPSQSREEMRRIVDLQIPSLVPYGREEVIFDVSLTGREPDGSSRALAVFVSRVTVDRYMQILHKCRLTPEHFVLSSQAIAERFFRDHPDFAGEPAVLIEADDAGVEVCFCENKQWVFSRSFSSAEQGPALLEDIAAAIKAHGQQCPGAGPERIFGSASVQRLPVDLRELAGAVSLPAETLPGPALSGGPHAISWGSPCPAQFSSAGVLGVMSAGTDQMMDFMPKDILARRAACRLRRTISLSAVLMVLAVGLLCFFMQAAVSRREAQVERLQEEARSLQTQVRREREKMNGYRAVDDRVQGRVLVVDAMKDLYDLMPENISLRSVAMSASGVWSVQGWAPVEEGVHGFQQTLAGSSAFRDVALEFATKKKMGTAEMIDFKLVFRLAASGAGGER
ncbi:MAG: PilN domain-containing protein [Candidatus Omnitrophota bacterium]|nr:PilN domain-containing protein [Candidatus Omnitrophota bacterium]MDZ4241368.1 PilN domain-containing protein [Candidatus Omnitrophota bacterium]